MRSTARAARAGWQSTRFRAWARRLDVELRRRGGRLVLDAPHGLLFDSPPRVRAIMTGDGDGTLTLRIGRNVRLGHDVHIEAWATGTNTLDLGDDAYMLDGVRILLRSGRVQLGARSHVRDFSVLKSQGALDIGADCQVSYHSVLHCRERVTLAERVVMAERVTIVDSEKARDGSDVPIVEGALHVAPVRLDRNVFVAAGAVIACGSHVGPNATVGANSVLTGGNYPGGWVIAGAPATAIRPLAQGAGEAGGLSSAQR